MWTGAGVIELPDYAREMGGGIVRWKILSTDLYASKEFRGRSEDRELEFEVPSRLDLSLLETGTLFGNDM